MEGCQWGAAAGRTKCSGLNVRVCVLSVSSGEQCSVAVSDLSRPKRFPECAAEVAGKCELWGEGSPSPPRAPKGFPSNGTECRNRYSWAAPCHSSVGRYASPGKVGGSCVVFAQPVLKDSRSWRFPYSSWLLFQMLYSICRSPDPF